MNFTTVIFLINKNVRAVLATYEADGPNGTNVAARVMFKTFDKSIKVGDLVVVPTGTRHKQTIVKVTDVDADVDLDSDTKIEWIISVPDQSVYADILAQEQAAITAIKQAEKSNKVDELRKKMEAEYGSALEGLRIAGPTTPALPAA